ncbi:MAG: DUF2267 domain-containing protein [Cytophagaceae bacterium]|nr:DUF2267 domain-containing protein [Cytophagaceae bacterium]
MINFERYADEGNEFLNTLAKNLGHNDNKAQVGILLRAVLHSIRDCITIPQSFHLIAELPMFLKALYVEQWRYSERPERIKKITDFTEKIESEQEKMGERLFNWNEPTIDLVKTVINSLKRYLQPGLMVHMAAELPIELKPLFTEHASAAKG